MSLQITPGVGGPVPTQGVTPTNTAGGSGQTTTVIPQYQLEFTGLSRASALGLAPPSSAGDLEVLFARISTALKDALGELSDMNDVAKAERFRGRLGEALAAFDQMVRWGQTVDINNENIRNQTDIENREIGIRDAAKTERDNLQSQRGPIEQQIRDNTTTIGRLSGEITGLSNERSNLATERQDRERRRAELVSEYNRLIADPVRNAARLTEINREVSAIDQRFDQIDARTGVINNSEIPGRQAQIGTLQMTNANLTRELQSLDSRIAAKQEEFDRAQSNINAAIKSRTDSETTVGTTLRTMERFIGNTIELMLVTAGNTRSDMGRASGQLTTEGDFFETLLQDMARALIGLGSTLLQSQRDVDVALHTSGAGLNQTQSTPDRFGQLSAPVARAIAFAGMIAGVLGAVADLVNGLSRGLGMQTAGSMASAGEPRVRVGL